MQMSALSNDNSMFRLLNFIEIKKLFCWYFVT
jgi:hypothetical protein